MIVPQDVGESLEQQSPLHQTASVLVVDDEVDLCRLLVRLLTLDGVAAAYVTSGEAALEFVKAHSIKVMLLDLMMPGTTGFEVLQSLRASKEFSMLPVVIYSARVDAEIRDEARLLGAQAFVAKAVDSFDHLQMVVKQYSEPTTRPPGKKPNPPPLGPPPTGQC